ncbi:hypothetical protein EJB05_55391 [Eragrostis curvula]|uniref:Uncharacterized protein n=1 Tax=Eragrostis curvula TaxID=38414 RepID=A0A5J9SJU4_9POAL|nr:hypothetical protein EJB05_55391 [Eragrostis curvula]
MADKGIGCSRRQKSFEKQSTEKRCLEPFDALNEAFSTQDMDSAIQETSDAMMTQISGSQMAHASGKATGRLNESEQGGRCLDYLESLYNNPQMHGGYTGLLMEQIRNSQEESNDLQAPQVSGCVQVYEQFGGLEHGNPGQPKQCGAYKGTFTELLLADNPIDDHFGLRTGIAEDTEMLFDNYNLFNTSTEYGPTHYETISNEHEASSIEGSSKQHEQNTKLADCESWGVGIFHAMNLQEKKSYQ